MATQPKPHPFQVLLTKHFRENVSAELSSKAENDVSRRASSSEEEEAYHSASEDTATSTIAAAREGEGRGRRVEGVRRYVLKVSQDCV